MVTNGIGRRRLYCLVCGLDSCTMFSSLLLTRP
uniref:Uncharacterized protein n=1 Tax=Solanum lycopersicum TaxID=4081 RepID=A0A3Q7I734_SOLLC